MSERPVIATPMPLATDEWVHQALRHVLARPVTTPSIAEVRDWSDVVHFIVRHRLVHVIAQAFDELNVPSSFSHTLRERHLQSVRAGLATAHDTAAVSSQLSTAGIDHLVVKGVALAGLLGPDLSARGSGDVDVWIRPSDVAATEEALAHAGWHRRVDATALPRAADGIAWRQFLWEKHEFPLARPSASDIDVHWRLCEFGPELSFDFDAARASASLVSIAGVDVPTLSGEHALEHCAQHGRKESWPTLRHVVDIVRLAHHLGDDEVRRLARVRTNVRRAIGLAAHLDPSLAQLIQLSRADERLGDEAWARCVSGSSWVVTRRTVSGWAGIRGWIDHASWLWRSAPRWRVRHSQVTHVLLRMRVLVDPRRRPWRIHETSDQR